MSPLITEKINELIALAEVEKEPIVQSTLLVLQGVRLMGEGTQMIFVHRMNDFTHDVLIPVAQSKIISKQAAKN